ncbi:hypothetical protein [Streptomyces fractus]|uniref:hypothetical protein n=1 Tax=Streptomyces fractus TaxID=641806 RepID=UPI003CF1EB6F
MTASAAVTDITPAPGVYVVLAQVVHGPPAEPVLEQGLYCSITCATSGLHTLVNTLRRTETGTGAVLAGEDRPVGCVITRGGRMWAVQILGAHELPDITA